MFVGLGVGAQSTLGEGEQDIFARKMPEILHNKNLVRYGLYFVAWEGGTCPGEGGICPPTHQIYPSHCSI